mgnify:CR=1 FL=1
MINEGHYTSNEQYYGDPDAGDENSWYEVRCEWFYERNYPHEPNYWHLKSVEVESLNKLSDFDPETGVARCQEFLGAGVGSKIFAAVEGRAFEYYNTQEPTNPQEYDAR